MPKLFSSRNRAPHFGPYPLERLPRSDSAPSAEGLAEIPPLRLPEPENPYSIANSFLGERFGAAVVSTSLEIGIDRPLAARGLLSELLARPAWWLGVGGARPAWGRLNGAHRGLAEGVYPMERIKRVDEPTTRINAGDIKRQPKRAEFFTRAAFGDIGPGAEREMHHGRFSEKEPIGATMSAIAAGMIPLQYGEPAAARASGSDDPEANAARIRALSHFLGDDIVGITPAYEHTWYSHHMDGKPIEPYHRNAIVLVLDQSQETMSGSSGDDWISNSQSFRAYMRGGFLASVIAEHIRGLGWSARSHTVWEEDVQHIPLCIHSGIGELSRIGETVLNPFLGPRFKDSIVTTDMPLAADKYVDFGLQDFCNKCTKCARECPCDAIPFRLPTATRHFPLTGRQVSRLNNNAQLRYNSWRKKNELKFQDTHRSTAGG